MVMLKFQSHEEFFDAFDNLVTNLEGAGHHQAAGELRDGLSCLNGLTDGWALFLESIEKVLAQSKAFTRDEQKELNRIRAGVRRIVYRR
jgi:hypothetical protein